MFGLFKKLDRIIYLLERLSYRDMPAEETKKRYKRSSRSKRLDTEAPEEFRTKLITLRLKNALSQTAISLKIGKGVTQSTISAFERGQKVSKMDFLSIVDFIEHFND